MQAILAEDDSSLPVTSDMADGEDDLSPHESYWRNRVVLGVGGAVVGGVAAVALAPALIAAAGFGAGGVVAGSCAAGLQSWIGSVAAGSLFASLQSAGAAGLAASTSAAIGAAGAAVGATVGNGMASEETLESFEARCAAAKVIPLPWYPSTEAVPGGSWFTSLKSAGTKLAAGTTLAVGAAAGTTLAAGAARLSGLRN